MRLKYVIAVIALVLSIFERAGRTAEFGAICTESPCKVVLNPDGVHVQEIHLRSDRILTWRSSRSVPLNDLQRGAKTAKGAVIGGLTGALLLGPVGAAVGAIWGGSEESSGDAAPDLFFEIAGYESSGKLSVARFQFENPDVARRFRMQLPMFTQLTSGELRSLQAISLTFPPGVKLDPPP